MGAVTSGPCSVALVWDPRFLAYDFGPGHPYTPKSRGLAVRLLESSGWLDRAPRVEALGEIPVAAREDLERFHEGSYLDAVERAGRSTRRILLDLGDTPAFAGCYEAAGRVTEGTLTGLRRVLEGAVTHAFQPAGGLHHAHPDRASGFCIFNDPAVAIRRALAPPYSLRRVAYIDIDAHHGDGVMYGFYADGRLLDIDFHQDGRTLFPGTGRIDETGRGDGAGLKVNVPLPPGAGDEALTELFHRIVPPLVEDFRPELIVLQTGVDGHVGDPLAQLQYTPTGYTAAVATVHALAHAHSAGRLLQVGGGGYDAGNVARVLARAAGLISGTPLPERENDPLPESWRSDFRRALGFGAPERWNDYPLPVGTTPLASRTDALVRALERALGRRFSPTADRPGSS